MHCLVPGVIRAEVKQSSYFFTYNLKIYKMTPKTLNILANTIKASIYVNNVAYIYLYIYIYIIRPFPV